MSFMIGMKDDSGSTTEPKKESTKPKAQKQITIIPADEIHDSKHASKIAHRSISPKYGEDGKISEYVVGAHTPSHTKYLEAEKLKKKTAN